MTRASLDSVRLPLDGSNTGKYTATRKKTISGTEYHGAVVVPDRAERVTGVYRASMALQSVQASSQNGTSTAFAWITIPVANTTRAARLRKCQLIFNHSAISATAMTSLPRIGLARGTFVGTASGATFTGTKIDPDTDQPVLDFRTASTGLTITLNTDPGSLLSCALVPPYQVIATPTNYLAAIPCDVQNLIDISADEDEWPLIKGGQCLILYQLDNGTSTDTRRFAVNLLWDEIEL